MQNSVCEFSVLSLLPHITFKSPDLQINTYTKKLLFSFPYLLFTFGTVSNVRQLYSIGT